MAIVGGLVEGWAKLLLEHAAAVAVERIEARAVRQNEGHWTARCLLLDAELEAFAELLLDALLPPELHFHAARAGPVLPPALLLRETDAAGLDRPRELSDQDMRVVVDLPGLVAGVDGGDSGVAEASETLGQAPA